MEFLQGLTNKAALSAESLQSSLHKISNSKHSTNVSTEGRVCLMKKYLLLLVLLSVNCVSQKIYFQKEFQPVSAGKIYKNNFFLFGIGLTSNVDLYKMCGNSTPLMVHEYYTWDDVLWHFVLGVYTPRTTEYWCK